ncbi:uncharacterized protein LOC114258916 [Camellia sinensis]|uniref:uncharacterized protein LOC114258916 n=1 Tax=Camellia sinensis TaxID=4442 RepID=UPI001035DFC3|nr:uncharacterized protein LOC114258916 [Camellia sinensis]
MASWRRIRNHITCVRDVDGNVLTEPKAIQAAFVDHFKKLFSPSGSLAEDSSDTGMRTDGHYNHVEAYHGWSMKIGSDRSWCSVGLCGSHRAAHISNAARVNPLPCTTAAEAIACPEAFGQAVWDFNVNYSNRLPSLGSHPSE